MVRAAGARGILLKAGGLGGAGQPAEERAFPAWRWQSWERLRLGCAAFLRCVPSSAGVLHGKDEPVPAQSALQGTARVTLGNSYLCSTNCMFFVSFL